MGIDDYDALEKIVSLLSSDQSFELLLLKFHLLAIDQRHLQLGFYSQDLSDKMKDLLMNLNEVTLRQVKFLFKDPPSLYEQ
ncbi:MAG: hypothetical protein FJ359_04395 [Thaumarchaeota archaeon]|nr:hypothetical protein [Nitrososphaerota archaeon]